jgi:hypothetical protein
MCSICFANSGWASMHGSTQPLGTRPATDHAKGIKLRRPKVPDSSYSACRLSQYPALIGDAG